MLTIFNKHDFQGVAGITNLGAATTAGQPVTYEQFIGFQAGMAWKDNVAASTTGNIDISSPGATHDGITLTTGKRLLVQFQTDLTQNGIYIFNGATSALTRATDANTGVGLLFALVGVDKVYRQTNSSISTLGTDDVTFTIFNQTALEKASGSFGNGSNKSFTITHTFATDKVFVQITEASSGQVVTSSFNVVPNSGNVVISVDSEFPAPTTNQFNYLIFAVK